MAQLIFNYTRSQYGGVSSSLLEVIQLFLVRTYFFGFNDVYSNHFLVFLNTGVHVIMYTYYMLAAFGPHMQKYLWWKKHLTMLQIVQFVAVFIHSMQLFFFNPCQFPIIFVWIVLGHAVMFFFLFKGRCFSKSHEFFKDHFIIFWSLLPKVLRSKRKEKWRTWRY